MEREEWKLEAAEQVKRDGNSPCLEYNFPLCPGDAIDRYASPETKLKVAQQLGTRNRLRFIPRNWILANNAALNASQSIQYPISRDRIFVRRDGRPLRPRQVSRDGFARDITSSSFITFPSRTYESLCSRLIGFALFPSIFTRYLPTCEKLLKIA